MNTSSIELKNCSLVCCTMNSAVTPCSLPIFIAFVERHLRSLSSKTYLAVVFWPISEVWWSWAVSGCTCLVGWAACFGTSLLVAYRYLLMSATLSLVLIKQASGININFNLGTPVAAKHDTISGCDSLGFLRAAATLYEHAYLISLKTSPAYPGRQHTYTISASATTLSLLNSAITPYS